MTEEPVSHPYPTSIQPFPHQILAAKMMIHDSKTDFAGSILADGPIGKTLSALMALKWGREPGDGPSLVVTSEDCAYQWMKEIRASAMEVCAAVRVAFVDYTNAILL